ncbi:MAG: transcription elongation factor GreB [Oligoflexia bacterium]|nr:transcription elongation factor GreB [Oligoflexia bacterium]
MNKAKEKNYITKSGYQKLQSELDNLLKIERPQITKVIALAAANGDRSENADYIYGKRRLREIDRRINFLQGRLNIAVVVDKQENQNNDQSNNNFDFNKVQFGATVTVMSEDDGGVEKTYTIVGVDEVDINKGRISWKSPLGNSLMGKQESDVVSFNTPNGKKELEIIEIKYLHID